MKRKAFSPIYKAQASGAIGALKKRTPQQAERAARRQKRAVARLTATIDIKITYTEGDAVAFLKPLTAAGRHHLIDHARRDCPRGTWVHDSALMEVAELLAFVRATMAAAKIQMQWVTPRR
jgi:hypothetical protein